MGKGAVTLFIILCAFGVYAQLDKHCSYEELPDNLNSIAYLGLNNEVHLHGEFYANFTNIDKKVNFTLNVESALRVYVAPHQVDIDLWLYDSTGVSIAHSLDIKEEEVLQIVLLAGSYTLKYLFFGSWIGNYSPTECDTMIMELEIVPMSTLTQRISAFHCPASESLPNIDFTPLSHGSTVQLSSSTVYNVNSPAVSGNTNAVRWIKGYNFTIPTGSSPLWKVEATIGYEFIISGSLGMILESATTAPDTSCYLTGGCGFGKNVRMNENVLRVVIPAGGNFTLWLYDQIGEKNNTVSPCTPFTFSLTISVEGVSENFITCEAPSIPTQLIPGGLYDDPPGYFHYRESPLIAMDQRVKTISFTIQENSFFRILIQDHRIDIDVRLRNETSNTEIDRSLRWGGEDAIAILLTPANYSIQTNYFGTYDTSFCETFDVDIAVVPQRFYPDFSFCARVPSLPDLSGLPASLAASQSYHLVNNLTYAFNFAGNHQKRTVLQQAFTITQASTFRAELGMNFVIGDMDIMLVGGNTTHYGHHRRNYERLYVTLQPGSYTFSIATGTIQYLRTTLAGFPDCALFTLKVEILPVTTTPPCFENNRLPTSLNTPQYLGSAGIVHIFDTYVVPLPSGATSTSEDISMVVNADSMFRIWAEPHHIDIDFILFENGVRKKSAVKLNEEEEFVYVLLAHMNYTLQVKYYHWSHSDPHYIDPACWTYTMSLSITPVSAWAPASCTTSLPPSTLIPDYVPNTPINQFLNTARYSYTQTDRSLNVNLYFTTQDFIFFRALIRYDFNWNDLSLRLLINNQTTVLGVNEYNRNDLQTILLGPGQYTLQIYEPAAMEVATYRRCTSFELTVAWQPSYGESQTRHLLGCDTYLLPPTLNTLPFLSELTSQTVHWTRNVLVEANDRRDQMDFTLSQASLLRLFIPFLTTVDVDVRIYNGTTPIVSRIGIREETILWSLPPGKYQMVTQYYGFRGGVLPPASECLDFPMEFSLTPKQFLDNLPQIREPCVTDVIPPIQINTQFSAQFKRSITAPNWAQNLTFVITQPTSFDFNLRYNFPSGGLILELEAVITETATPVTRKFYSMIGVNHAFFHKNLVPGNYTLIIVDRYDYSHTDTALKCSPFSIDYVLNTSNVINYCDDTNLLPTDLNDPDGGSAPYGGPQAPDGSIRIFGEDFLLSADNGRHNYMTFRIPPPLTCFMRVFVKFTSNSDIDLFIYDNTNGTTANTVAMFVGVENIESGLVTLNPQQNDYMMDVYFFRIGNTADIICPTFYFELAIKTNTTVVGELLCPTTLPTPEVPPPQISFSDDVWLYYDNMIFTKTRIDGNTHNGRFTYRITLDVHGNTTLFVALEYDFLANDFRMVLRDSANEEITQGEPGGIENREDYFNFFNLLYAELDEGTYYLDIVEDIRGKNFGLTNYCHRFGFFLVGLTWAVPEILYVVPSGGSELNPFEDLTLTITFSETVALPSGSLLNYIRNNRAIYLSPTDQPSTQIFPSVANFDLTVKVLEVIFGHSNFEKAKTYRLYIDASKFNSTNGTPFRMAQDEIYAYQMTDCQCSGHGHCPLTSVTCICDPGYAGDDCSACADGFHPVAAACEANIPCTTNFCNAHGVCNDTRGYPQCVCFDGYIGSYCTLCAAGFGNYPNCTSNGDETERENICSAPLIPDTLDPIAYLKFNGEVHLQDNYYIDVDNMKHDTQFSLTTDSVFRVYVEPHWIDIDLWLYSLKDDGSIDKYIANGIAIGREETIFLTLPGGSKAHPIQYLLRFRYFIWDRERTASCETFNLELAISPVTVVTSEASRTASTCASADKFPTPASSPSGYYQLPSDSYVYDPADVFTIRSRPNAGSTANYFYKWNFRIEPPAGKVAIFRAHIGYRFLAGDLALLLEEGTRQNHCGSDGGYAEDCENGVNSMNTNSMHKILGAGNYTLWVYEPEPQNSSLTTCSLFTFGVHVSYFDLEEDVFYCSNTRLFPKSFNTPGYLDSTGRMHLREHYLIEDARVSFQLNETSLLRVHGKTDSLIVLQVVNDTSGATIGASWMEQDPELFISLPPGKYLLRVNSFIVTPTFCPRLNMEVEIEPVALVPHTCPGQESLPVLGDIRVPFSFPATPTPTPTAYYAYTNNEVIRQYTFTLDAVAVIEAMLDSDFVTAGLKLALEFTSSGNRRTISGSHQYNRNYLHEILDPGSYTLKISRPSPVMPIATLPPCAEFNFAMTLKPMSVVNQDPCSQSGEALPESFDAVRYLGIWDEFDFQSHEMRVPDFSTYIQKRITIPTAAQPAMLRVYTEPHVVDIDLALYLNETSVANAGYGFNNEESLVYLLQPGKVYTLSLTFWKWSSDIPPCPRFSMEVSIIPEIHAKLQTTGCGTGEHWPPSPPSLNLPSVRYQYDSVAQNDTLYYMQNSATTMTSPAITFTLNDKANLHAELGYEFLTGDLLMRLENTQTNEKYYGDNTMSGEVLNLVDLPPGSYRMFIYEVTKYWPSDMGCSHFTFSLFIERDQQSQISDQYQHLPRSLDSIPYLAYDGRVHFQGQYSLFDDLVSTNQRINFTLAKQSLVRVTTSHDYNSLGALQIQILNAAQSPIAAFQATGLDLLPPAIYYIEFKKPLNSQGRMVVNIELEIAPSDSLKSDIAYSAPATCTDQLPPTTVVPNPDGYYQYRKDDLRVTQNTLSRALMLQTINIQLNRASVIYTQLGSPFLLSDLSLTLTGTTSMAKTVNVAGRNGRNLNEINQVLPVGTYSLKIAQTTAFSYLNDFPHCTEFSFRLVIQDKEDTNTHVDCTAYSVLPWDLSSPTGGSSNYGGPINSRGMLHLFGENFLMPTDTNAMDTIHMRLNETSLLAIITRESYFGDITYSVQNTNTSMRLIIPARATTTDHTQRHEIFLVNVAQPLTPFDIELYYQPPLRTPCPYFGLQILLQPVAQLNRTLACPPGLNKLPNTTVVIPANGAYTEYLDSYFPSTTISDHPTHDIKVTVATTSVLFVSISYNALVSMIDLKLSQETPGGSTHEIGSGQILMQTTVSGESTVNLVLTGTLLVGTYHLTIIQPLNFVPITPGNFCYPYIWDLQIVPDEGFPYITTVDPPSGTSISPTSPLELEIAFSVPIYTGGRPVTQMNSEALQSALYLYDIDEPTSKVSPNPPVNDEVKKQYWHISFPGTFKPMRTYKLALVPNIITDNKNKSVSLISTNTYKMLDTSCSGHGTFDSGYCFCFVGYAGSACTQCADGYENIAQSGPLICKRKTGQYCFEDSCGCDKKYPESCVPLGKCNESTGSIVCECYRPYTGTTCNACVSGYVMTADGCVVEGTCPICVRGQCDPTSKTCICPERFTGTTCDECDKGWSGDDCNEAVPYEKPDTPEEKYSPALNAFRVIIIIAACLVIVGTVAFLLYRRYFHKGKYLTVGMEELELDNEDDSRVVDSDKVKQRKKTTSDDDADKLVPLDD